MFLGKEMQTLREIHLREWAILKFSWKRKQIPAPKINYGCRKTKWEFFKNYQCVKKNNGKGFSNLELELGFQMNVTTWQVFAHKPHCHACWKKQSFRFCRGEAWVHFVEWECFLMQPCPAVLTQLQLWFPWVFFVFFWQCTAPTRNWFSVFCQVIDKSFFSLPTVLKCCAGRNCAVKISFLCVCKCPQC